MATEKQGLWGRFMHWYESYDGKNKVNIIYSVGASVVIIGALFKILHWPGASTVLMIGMFTEAFLFLIGTLEHPHPEFHWDNVFPQLLEYGTKPELLEEKSKLPRPTLLGAGVAGSPVTATGFAAAGGEAAAAAPSAKAPGLKDEDFKDGSIDIIGVLVAAGLVQTRSDGRRAVEQGGVTFADEKVTDFKTSYTPDVFKDGVMVRRGKKTYKKVRYE